MMNLSLHLILVFLYVLLSCSVLCDDRPVIGVLCHETRPEYRIYGSCHIAASYVKFLESSGSRVVPIMINKTEPYYRNLLGKLNGVLLPGGSKLKGEGYGSSGEYIFNIATEMNEKKDYFPLWGSCLGFELLNYLVANKKDVRTPCDAEDMPANINFADGSQLSAPEPLYLRGCRAPRGQFAHESSCHRYYDCWDGRATIEECPGELLFNPVVSACDYPEAVNCGARIRQPGFQQSKLFKNADQSQINTMKEPKVTIHYHKWCFTTENYKKYGLDKFFKMLSVNKDTKNVPFVNIVEAKEFPFFGVAFHPEKPIFEWVDKDGYRNIPHSAKAIRVSRYFADFIVNEARKNNHKFPKDELNKALIYNYNATFTGKRNSIITQYYFFK